MSHTKNIPLLLLLFCFLSNFIFSQKIIETHRIVLVTDSSNIFEKKFAASQFGESYFMFLNEYGVSFTEDEFNNLKLNCDRRKTEIKVFKSIDNKKLTCVFPKTALHGIGTLDEFLNSNFSSNCKSNVVLKKITFIEVRGSFNSLDAKIEKGF